MIFIFELIPLDILVVVGWHIIQKPARRTKMVKVQPKPSERISRDRRITLSSTHVQGSDRRKVCAESCSNIGSQKLAVRADTESMATRS